MGEVVREDRPQVEGDHRTGGNTKTGDVGRDGGKVLGHVEGDSEEGAGSGGGKDEEAEAAAGGQTAEVAREDRPQVGGDLGTGDNAETSDDGRDGGEVLGKDDEAKGVEAE